MRHRSKVMLLAIVTLTTVLHLPALGVKAADESENSESKNSVPMLTKRFRITNPQGQPVAGATVIPWAVRSEQGHGPWRINDDYTAKPPTIVTDAEGRGEFAFPRFIDKDHTTPPASTPVALSIQTMQARPTTIFPSKANRTRMNL